MVSSETSLERYLDMLFDGAERLMWELSEADGHFTNYGFIRRAAQENQAAYVNLLKAALDQAQRASDTDVYPFQIAHAEIGKRLSRVARQVGYETEGSGDEWETNVWGDPVRPLRYCRTARLLQPSHCIEEEA